MPHSISLITTIAAALGLALILGFVAVRLRLPALVGYLIAGVIIGPATPGGVPAVSGDALEPEVLIQAHVARARLLVVAVPDTFRARKMIEIARTLKPDVETVVRTHSDEEAALLRKENAGQVFMGEHELALGMTRYVLERVARRPLG